MDRQLLKYIDICWLICNEVSTLFTDQTGLSSTCQTLPESQLAFWKEAVGLCSILKVAAQWDVSTYELRNEHAHLQH